MNDLLTTNTLPILSGLAAGILLIGARFSRQQKTINVRQKGLRWLLTLKNLLAKLQQHRGLSTGYLHGRAELAPELKALHERISAQLKDISDPWFDHNERWQQITGHWSRLQKNYPNNSPGNNITQHNLLIKNVLYLIDDMAEEHGLGNETSAHGTPLRYAWKELLNASEYIGQARALGTAVAAEQHCDTAAKIRLKYLYNKIQHASDTALQTMPANPKLKQQLNALMTCIDEQLLKPTPTISVADYFHIATQALDGLLHQYDCIVTQCKGGPIAASARTETCLDR